MDQRRPSNLETVVHGAIRTAPCERVPLYLHRAVRNRLRIAAMAEGERKHFRRCVTTLGGFCIALVTLLAGTIFLFNSDSWIRYSIPGVLGYYDYAINSWGQFTLEVPLRAAGAMAAGIAFLVLLLIGIKPLRRYLTSNSL
ncbi:MAG: hypothetical protein HY706_01590 [Candidatus Hydrogenedentes bacterium]|nr:hypothetical protein [Candidatus Hydrogenedentota bacterium]